MPTFGEILSNATTWAVPPPSYTTAQRDALTGLTAGRLIYNSTLATLQYYNGSAWTDVIVGIGAQTLTGKVTLTGNDAGGGALNLVSSADADFLKAIVIKAGTTASQRRYFEWQDFDSSVTGRFGMNTSNSFILYKNGGGPAGNAYHIMVAFPLALGGTTSLNSATAVFINQDGETTGGGGMIVWDGTSNATATAENKFGTINSVGVQAHNGKFVQAESTVANGSGYVRLFGTASGYLTSDMPLRLHSLDDIIEIVDSAFAVKMRIHPNLRTFTLVSPANDADGSKIRLIETDNTFQGAYLHYDGLANELILGTHDASDSLTASDLAAIKLTRATGTVSTRHHIFQTDNTYDLGAAGATRPRTGYFGTSIFCPTFYGSSQANGVVTIEGTSNATKTTAYVVLQPTGGLVGIGTATPAYRLTVVQTSAAAETTPMMLANLDSTAATAVKFRMAVTAAPTGNTSGLFDLLVTRQTVVSGAVDVGFLLSPGGAVAPASVLFMQGNSGNVGMGVSAFGTSATKTFALANGTAPTGSIADAAQLYSADQAAGNACLHTRTENGAIIKLYRETTAVAEAAFVENVGGTAVNVDSTFGGYTLQQIAQALQNEGLLA